MRNFKVVIDGKEYQVGVEEIGATESVAVSEPVVVKEAPKAKPVGNGKPVKAPMPGMIKDLKFAEGASVKKGDVIVILEAMKMDNDITAESDGTISYRVTKGKNVETDEIIAVIG